MLPVGPVAERWEGWRTRMAEYQATVRALAEQYDAVFAPLQDAFDSAAARTSDPSYWIWDGIHPTTAGHQLIADRWLGVVQAGVAEWNDRD